MNYSLAAHSDPYAWTTSLASSEPLLTSEACAESLTAFFHEPDVLSVALESSSHPAGLLSLLSQPWVYAGGGLGNIDECNLQTCIAGGNRRDSLIFAAVCVPPQCSAYDLAANDFLAALERSSMAENETMQSLVDEYVTLHSRIAELNQFLGTGWTCGDFVVPWQWWPWGIPFITVCLTLIVASAVGTLGNPIGRWNRHNIAQDSEEEQEKEGLLTPSTLDTSQSEDDESQEPGGEMVTTLWSAFDLSSHVDRLQSRHSPATACIDGLRVGSIAWIMMGHVIAIVSSSGPGYSNPSHFLPPTGWTSTLSGQLLFSSRLAVDSFFCLSGFLVVHVLLQKLPWRDATVAEAPSRYVRYLPALLIARVVRILPLYAFSLGLYTQIAPHLGSGPFWHQWLPLLQPCHDFGWTNFAFVNNFWPADKAITDTCFYHSWYLAVDMQLFAVAPVLVFVYQASASWGKRIVGGLWLASVIVTTWLAYDRHWSLNTFDGAAVARFDVEGYAKPHIRAQSYLAGMMVAMMLPAEALGQRARWSIQHVAVMVATLTIMTFVVFCTATGAYSRRPCGYGEWPELNLCGSAWSSSTTFLYAAFSRTIWTLGVAVIMHLCLGRRHLLSQILSWKCWTPLSNLAFGAYLLHPIVIFVWQLGNREKGTFRLMTFGMDYLSVCLVSFVFSLLAALFIELPCAALWKHVGPRPPPRAALSRPIRGFSFQSRDYGSIQMDEQKRTV